MTQTTVQVDTALARALADNPGIVIEEAAKTHGVTPRQVIEALPVAMRAIGPGSAFVDAMVDIGSWGDVTLIVHTDDGIFEASGPVPAGEVGRGYYNVPGGGALHGHLRHERCGGVAFVERSFMGRSSAFVAFLNVDGGIMFKVFVGRDAERNMKADQLAAFRRLREKVCRVDP